MSKEANAAVAQHGLDAKRQSAKDYLGAKWVCHPGYRYSTRHSNDPTVFVQARQQYLHEVSLAARLDREINSAFIRAENLRTALNH